MPPTGAPNPAPIDAHVGTRLAELRHARTLSVDAVASHICVDQDFYRTYENGTVRVSGRDLLLLANFFDVPIAYFFEEFTVEDMTAAMRDSKPRPRLWQDVSSV